MPASKKSELLTALCIQNIFNLLDSDSNDDDEMNTILKFTVNAALVLHNRRSSHFGLPKSSTWAQNVLTNLDDGRWRHMLRVSKKDFDFLLSLIENDDVFQHFSIAPQMPVDLQLKIALFRFGSYGDSASIRKVATLFGVGDGETVITATKRVIQALVNLKSDYLFWPSPEERKKLVAQTMHELPGCLGYIDGTEIRLAEAPANNHELYFSRKKQYSIKMQIVCDHRLKIRHAVIGYHGSVHDARIFAESSICDTPHNFFCEKQFIAGDSAYRLSQNLITPFRQNSAELTEEERAKFNVHFSKYRVRVENCFGQLKEIFSSLKELRFRLTDKKNHSDCCNWILACCIIYNILLEHNSPEVIEDYEQSEYPEEINSENDMRGALVNFIMANF